MWPFQNDVVVDGHIHFVVAGQFHGHPIYVSEEAKLASVYPVHLIYQKLANENMRIFLKIVYRDTPLVAIAHKHNAIRLF